MIPGLLDFSSNKHTQVRVRVGRLFAVARAAPMANRWFIDRRPDESRRETARYILVAIETTNRANGAIPGQGYEHGRTRQ